MSFGRNPGGFARWMLAPIGWPSYFLFILFAVVGLWIARQQPPVLLGANLLLAVALWILLGATQMVWLVVNAVVSDIYRRPQHTLTTARGRWARLWLIYLILTLPLLPGLPFRLNFALSSRALDRYARASLAGDSATHPPRSVGGFYLRAGSRKVVESDSTVILRLTGSLQSGGTGIAYDPAGLLRSVPHSRGAGALGGDWYWWEDGG